MKKVFVETSVIIRFLTQDDETKYQHCVDLFDLITQGKIRPYISNIVILEITFILIGVYKFAKKDVTAALKQLVELRNITIIDKTNTKKALKLFETHNIKHGDCFIVTQIPPQATLLTYDKELLRLPDSNAATPEDFLRSEQRSEFKDQE